MVTVGFTLRKMLASLHLRVFVCRDPSKRDEAIISQATLVYSNIIKEEYSKMRWYHTTDTRLGASSVKIYT
jgi:hypothetical protein